MKYIEVWCFGTHICESGQGAEVAHTHQAKDKLLPSLDQDVGILVQHGRDHPLQACELYTGRHQGQKTPVFGKPHDSLHTAQDREEARFQGRKMPFGYFNCV